MNDDTGGSQRRRRAWPRRAGALAAVAGIAVLATACSGGSSAPTTGSTGGSTTYQKALAFAHCMRSNGVPDFPDPNSSGGFTFNGSNGGGHPNTGGPAKGAALNDCRHLDPNGGTVTPAEQQQFLTQALRFTRCMRAHGLPNFPDPTTVGQIRLPSGIDKRSPQLQSALRACQSVMPGRLGGPGQAGGAP
jgi:hypothetical protein